MSLLCLANILRHEAVAPGHYRLTFSAPEMARTAQPGQFVHVRCGDTLDPLLRRPLSLHGIDRAAGTLTLLYRVVGRGTELLSRRPAGATLDVMGPLGRGFYLPEPVSGGIAQGIAQALSKDEKAGVALKREPQEMKLPESSRPLVTEALVVGGGLGVAPLLPLVGALVKRGLPVTVILGARSADGLLAVEEFSQTGAQVEIATDDGSRGTPGNAVDLLKQQLEQKGFKAQPTGGGANGHTAEHIPEPKRFTGKGLGGAGGVLSETGTLAEGPAGVCVYACGPAPMLRAVWQLCAAYQVPLQVSLEERMGCGVGACLACVCQVKTAAKPAGTAAEAPGDAEADDKVMTNTVGAVSETTAAAAVDDRAMTNPAGAAGKAAEPKVPEWKYARVCVEGPVFWGEEVILDAE